MGMTICMRAAALAGVVALAGCGSTAPHLVANDGTIPAPQDCRLVIVADSTALHAEATPSIEQTNQEAISLQSSAQSAAQNGGGGAPGLLATFISMGITNSIISSEAQAKADGPIAQLKTDVPDKAFSAEFQQELGTDVTQAMGGVGVDRNPKCLLKVVANATLTNDHKFVHVHMVYAAMESALTRNGDNSLVQDTQRNGLIEDSRRVHLRGELDYYSDPYDFGVITPDLGERFNAALATDLTGIAGLLTQDLEQPRTPPKVTGIRLTNSAGEYYLRGTLLSTDGGRVLFRSSRGGLKSWPGALSVPEGQATAQAPTPATAQAPAQTH